MTKIKLFSLPYSSTHLLNGCADICDGMDLQNSYEANVHMEEGINEFLNNPRIKLIDIKLSPILAASDHPYEGFENGKYTYDENYVCYETFLVALVIYEETEVNL